MFVATMLQLGPPTDCPSAKPGEILVSGSRSSQSPYRIPKLPKSYDGKPIRAETDAISGVHTPPMSNRSECPTAISQSR